MKKQKTETTGIGGFIFQKLEEKDRTVAWLSGKVGRNESNLRKTLEKGKYIHYELMFLISKALDVDIFAYGSQKLKET